MPPNEEFFDAISDGEVEDVRRMLAQDPSLLEQPNEYGSTPLMRAVGSMERTPELVRVLLDAGADVNAATDEGYTPLHMMVDVDGPSGTGEIPGALARLLVDAGAELEVRQHWGWTPLMRAVVEGTADELRALVDIGGEVDNTFPDHTLPAFLRGRTTLMAAVGSPEKTKILLGAGVDVSARDAHGQTALEYAEERLAAAGEAGPVTENLRDESSALYGQMLTKLQDLMTEHGIDLGTAIDGEGTTIEQSMARSLETMRDEFGTYDYEGSLRASIEMIRQAVAGL